MSLPLISMPSGAEWLIVLAIIILVFGAAKLPDLARATGQSLRIFKAETKGLRDDDEPATPSQPTTAELESGEPVAEGEIVEPRRETNG